MIFVDEARIFVAAGDGGKGCESYHKLKYMRYPKPDGGDGGKGGDVVFLADRSIHTLLDFKYKQHYKAQKGGNASSKGKKGRTGKSCYLRVPIGTIIRDKDNGLLIKDLVKDQQSVVVAKGGAGGLGNQNRKMTVPPKSGEKRTISLELKLVADVGIIGFPNAGKSTLISRISKVKSKVANYPFTTKQPILGIVPVDEDFSFAIADLPGIIEGAHRGRGIGHRFLRHAERTKVLVHVLDMAGTEQRDPLNDYEKLNNELDAYSDLFSFKHKIVVANKMDLPDSAKHLKRFRKKYKERIFPISCAERQGLEKLVLTVRDTLCQEDSPEKSNVS
jgi:GTP-binding protein